QLMKRCWTPLLLLLGLATAGCSSGNYQVRGVVTSGGQPVPDADVRFVPVEAGGRGAHGKTDKEGRFELMTLRARDGVWGGKYKVVITPAGPPNIGPPPPPGVKVEEKIHPSDALIPQRYRKAASTPLSQVVPPPEGEIKFELSGE